LFCKIPTREKSALKRRIKMIKKYIISNNKIEESIDLNANILIYSNPTEEEKQEIIEKYKIEEHALNSALDPNELSRLEFEDEYITIIFKAPKNYSGKDTLFFKASTIGVFLFKETMIIVTNDEMLHFEKKLFIKLNGLQDIILKLVYQSIYHFIEHLKVINMISDELENKISKSMQNKYLLNLFTLEKSLIYYLNAIDSNGGIVRKLRNYSSKLKFTEENMEMIDDLMIENTQCYKQAEIYSNILSGMMDARASLVNNNLNLLMKKLTFVTIGIMLPNFVVSAFSMNVKAPFKQDSYMAFWVIMFCALLSGVMVFIYERKN
jgi:magnesium transporter